MRACLFFFSSRRRHTRWNCDWSSDVCSSDLSLDVPHRVQRAGHELEGDLVLGDVDPLGDVDLAEHALPKEDRKSTRLNSSHSSISYAVFCLKKKKKKKKNKIFTHTIIYYYNN